MDAETKNTLVTILYVPFGIWLVACALIIASKMGKLGAFGDWMVRKEKKIVAVLATMFAFAILIVGVGALLNKT